MHIEIDTDDNNVGFTPDEYEVADILVNLPALIFDEETRRNPNQPLDWEDRKNRSPVDLIDGSQLLHDSTPPPSPENMAVDTPPTTATPDDPLSPTQPDRKRHRHSDSKAKRLLKRNEELLQEIHQLTQHKELMETELENLRLYHETQKTYNAKLKARKQKLLSRGGLRREELRLTIGSTSLNLPLQTISEDHCRIPIVNLDQTASRRSNMAPVIPDLNETIWIENDNGAFDQADFGNNCIPTIVVDHTAAAAAARLRRRQINKTKKSQVHRL